MGEVLLSYWNSHTLELLTIYHKDFFQPFYPRQTDFKLAAPEQTEEELPTPASPTR